MNWGPLSVTMLPGTPNRAMMFFMMNLHMVEPLISANASALAHLVKYSVVVRMKDFCFILALGSPRGPMISKAHMGKGQGEDSGCKEEEGAWILSA